MNELTSIIKQRIELTERVIDYFTQIENKEKLKEYNNKKLKYEIGKKYNMKKFQDHDNLTGYY